MIETFLKAAVGQRGTGYRPGQIDAAHIDGLIGASSVLLPNASVRQDVVRPKDQSASESCVGQSAAQAYRISCLAKGILCPELSALTTYAWGRAAIGLQGQDVGMTLEAMLTAIERFGVASEAAWPFSLLNVNRNPSGTALHDAYDRRGLRGYYTAPGTDSNAVRRAISKNVCAIGAWPLDADFGRSVGSALIDVPKGPIVGYHALVIEDYRADGTFGILNHYGEQWRDSGRCRFTEAYLEMSEQFVFFDVVG